jgi:hypothetical protein
MFEIAERWVSSKRGIPASVNLLDEKVTYPQVFTSAGTEGLIEQWLSTRGMINSDTYDKEMQAKIVDSALGDLSAEKKEQILAEIQENETIKDGFSGEVVGEEKINPSDFMAAMQEQEEGGYDDDDDATDDDNDS